MKTETRCNRTDTSEQISVCFNAEYFCLANVSSFQVGTGF